MSASDPRVTCDGCGGDITYTGNSVDYRIRLHSENLHPRMPDDGSGCVAVTDMMIFNPLPQPKHFCGLDCLFTWAEPHVDSGREGRAKARERRAVWQRKRDEAQAQAIVAGGSA